METELEEMAAPMWERVLQRCSLLVVRLVEDAELSGLIALAGILAFVGQKTSEHRPAVRRGSWLLAAVFFLCLLGLWIAQDRMYGKDLADLTFRGLLGAGALYGGLCIVALPLVALYRLTLQDGWRGFRRWLRESAEQRKRRREERRREQAWAEGAPAREEERRRREEQACRGAASQKRRQEARASCEVLFVRHQFEIRQRFTREMFDAFLAKFMADTFTTEQVEQRAKELKDVIRAHVAKVDPPRKSLGQLAEWFVQQKREIENASLSEEDRDMMLAQLEERYVRLQEQYLRSVKP